MIKINDQINEKNVALVIKGTKLTAKLLAKAMIAALKAGNKLGKKLTTPKNYQGKGKQSVKNLTRQGQGVTNIEISDSNIKSFEGVARKYGVDFALKKDITETPPKWLVFFKAKDTDALTSAFKEFSAKELQNKSKPSVLAQLEKFNELIKNMVVNVTKNKDRGGHER